MEERIYPEAADTSSLFEEMLENGSITPHFQPIFDLYTGDIFGYEILSRGEYPFESPAVVTDANFTFSPHPDRLSEIAAHLKKKIKSITSAEPRSGYLAERRTYQD